LGLKIEEMNTRLSFGKRDEEVNLGHREELIQRSIPFLREVRDMAPGAAMDKWLTDKHGEKSDLYKDLAKSIKLSVEDGWATNEEVDGRNYRRSRLTNRRRTPFTSASRQSI
jgi:hypothetical protein